MQDFSLARRATALCGATGAFAQSDFEVGTAEGVVTITKYKGSAKNLVIPAAINGLPVTTIGEAAFNGCDLDTATSAEITKRFGNAPLEDL